jgi:asparagine synthase (glutamine-hydrolysing)
MLERLTAELAFRGPDGQRTWNGPGAGLGHAALNTTGRPRLEVQPFTLDGSEWIVADARVDGRPTLRRKLDGAGFEVAKSAGDAELILWAYRAWGEDCVERLIGDFAFAIWDARRKRLFCARDHFGVKPFFYARVGERVVFGNTLGCVRQHPDVTDHLNERAIADFLQLGLNHDEGSTVFEDVRRLPPAHRLRSDGRALRVERYWHLPAGGRLRYRRGRDYVERFSEHLDAAVSDRLRNDRVGVLMSGGLDSTSVAAVAKAQLSRRHDRYDLRAYTCVYDGMFVDEERRVAGQAAEALGMPIHYLAGDGYGLFDRWRELALPEPTDEPLAAIYIDQAREMAGFSPVALTGWDGDALLGETRRSFGARLYRGVGRARRAVQRMLSAACPQDRESTAIYSRISRKNKGNITPDPEWIRRDTWQRLNLSARGSALRAGAPGNDSDHGNALRSLGSPLLTNLLESYDPGITRVPLETRHPLLDIRLVTYVLSIPRSPWCIDKKLLREAMVGRLPEPVRSRPKAPLSEDPVVTLLGRRSAAWVNQFRASPALGRYVDRAAVPEIDPAGDPERIWTDLRPLCLNLWLENLVASGLRDGRGKMNEVA